jgi:hypothetical protein
MNRWDAGVRATRRITPDDALGTALWLVGQGLWPVPITPPDDPFSPNPGKAPLGRGWGSRRLSTRALFAIFRRHPRAGVGRQDHPRVQQGCRVNHEPASGAGVAPKPSHRANRRWRWPAYHVCRARSRLRRALVPSIAPPLSLSSSAPAGALAGRRPCSLLLPGPEWFRWDSLEQRH